MPARGHLKLIVSEAPASADEPTPDRASLVHPISLTRLRLRWLRAHALTLCATVTIAIAIATLLVLHH